MSGTAPPKVAASSGQPAPSLPNATPSGQAVTAAGQPTVPLPPVPLAARHGWAAPLMCLAALASIAIPWIDSYPFSPLLISLPFTAGLSAAVMALWSAVLWLLAARTTDTLPNTAAAGLSGGAALFGAGTVSILQQRLDTSPIPASLNVSSRVSCSSRFCGVGALQGGNTDFLLRAKLCLDPALCW